MSPKFSIIIPIYNVSGYLRQCLESLKAQSFTDFEVLMVDDGSSDASAEICTLFTQDDDRFRLFRKANGGVGSARNLGLDEARGEWVWFVDGDDWLEPDALLSVSCYTSDCSLIDVGYFENQADKEVGFIGESGCFELADYAGRNFAFTVWKQIYKRDVIASNFLSFSDGLKYGEDQEFIIKYQCVCGGKARCVGAPLYHYRLRDGSAMMSGRYSSIADDHFSVVENLADYCSETTSFFDGWFKARVQRLLKSAFVALKNVPLNKESLELYSEKIKELDLKYKGRGLDCFSSVEFMLAKYSLSIYFKVMDFYMSVKKSKDERSKEED